MDESARILVVDDDQGIRRSLKNLLEHEGYVVDTAETGEEAIQKTETNYYNLALLDIRLPDMAGTILLNALEDTTPKMIKIVITGYPSLENAVEAVNQGADGYIKKPFDPPNLLHKIREQLQRQQEARKYSEDRVADYIESRVRELKKEKADQDNPQYLEFIL
ncbi:MAG: response regulator [Thermoproteota archaeon]